MDKKKIRKAINFDLDDNILKAVYPKPKSYKRAWGDIAKFMRENGFIHRQYSGYESVEPITQIKVNKLIKKMIKALPWLTKNGVIQQIYVTDIGETYSLKHLFEKDIVQEKDIVPLETEEKPSIHGKMDSLKKQIADKESQKEKTPSRKKSKDENEID